MKRTFCLVICLFILLSNPVFYSQTIVYAETATQIEIEVELEENIEEQLDNLDTSNVDELFGEIINSSELFSGGTFKDKIKGLINGDVSIDASSFFSYIASLFLGEVVNFLPSVCLIIAIAVAYSMLSGISQNKNKGISDIVHFACYGAIVVIVIAGIGGLINSTSATLQNIKSQMDAIFPLLLTTLTALGSVSSVNIFQPAMAILSSSVITIFINILLPIFTFKLIFTIISNLSVGIKFNKFADFFGSLYKWLIGIILTVFSAFVSIQGLMAGSVDGISMRTAKYTIKSSIPLIGGFLSDGVSLIMLSSSLIKNAVGVGGLLLMFSTIIAPVVQIIVFSFLMKFACAILEPIADPRITSFVSDMSRSISLIISLILGVAFMYFIIVGLVMCSVSVI